MKRSRFSEEQVIGILKEHEVGVSVAELCRKHAMSSATFYSWKAKFGGLEVSDWSWSSPVSWDGYGLADSSGSRVLLS